MLDPAIAPPDARGLRVAVVTSGYHARVTTAMHEGAVRCFEEAGGDVRHLLHVAAPGAWEAVGLCRAVTERGGVDGIVALGCIVTGETRHDEHLARAVAHGLVELVLRTGVPTSFGVLTCATTEQALARAGGDRGNKGIEAMAACLLSIRAGRALAEGRA